MKKYLLFFILFIAVSFAFPQTSAAQTYKYRTTAYAQKYVSNGKWTDWTDWQSSDMLMTINFDNDIVKIYSPKTQIYKITEYVRKYTDASGGVQIELNFVDQDFDRGTMRLRIESNGNSQVYIDFADVMWVYNVRRI